MLRDLRFALRQLSQSKGFTLTAIVTLALGIGANTGMFTLINAIMLKSLPVADPARLVRLGDGDNCCVIGGFQGGHFGIYAYPLYTYLRDHTPEFEEMAAFQAGLPTIGVRKPGAAVSEPFSEQFVSGNYFLMFGIRPFVGRLLAPEDDRRGAPPVAVMSYRAWQHFGRAAVLGTTFILDGAPYTIAGIAPPEFFGDTVRPNPPDFWVPLAAEPAARKANSLLDSKDSHWLFVIGRLKPGVAAAAIEPKVNVGLRQWFLANDLIRTDTERQNLEKQHIALIPAGAGVTSMRLNYEHDLRLLLLITVTVLLIACANLANLQLARGASNHLQNSIRAALGASRMRLIRLMLAESVALAVLGGAVGLVVAEGLAQLLLVFAFPGAGFIPVDTTPSPLVLAATFALSLATGMVFGIAPAWSASRADPSAALRGAGRSTGHATMAQKSLVVMQVALSVVLLTAAGLMVATLRNLQDQQFGFRVEGTLVADVQAGFSGYAPERLASIYRDLELKLRQIQGVRSTGLALYSPMSQTNWQSGVTLEERPQPMVSPSWDRVSPGFFETMGATVFRGRVFDERDTPDSVHVAVVNQAFAEKYFPNEDPLGKRFGLGDIKHAADYQIAGVVKNLVFRNPRKMEDHPMFFLPLLQMSKGEWNNSGMSRSNLIGNIVIRAGQAPADLTAQIQSVFATLDPNLTLVRMAAMQDQLGVELNHERLLARLAELFGGLALLLASVGLYGVTAYTVAQRTAEIGVRTALGATRGRIIALILTGALGQMGVGLVVGIGSAVGAGRVLAGQLYNVKASDPRILALASALLGVCAVIAALAPAMRAAGIDPARTLRREG